MAELLKSLTGLLTPGVMQRAAVLVGESPTDTQRALATRVLPAVVARLAHLASSDSGLREVAELVDRAARDRSPLGDLGTVFGGGATTRDVLRTGREHARSLFGRELDAVAAEVAAAGGVQVAAAATLLDLAPPVVLAALAADRAPAGLDERDLARRLASERQPVMSRLTPGLRTLVGASGAVARAAPAAPLAEPPRVTPVAAHRPLWPFAIVLLAAVAGVLLTQWPPEQAPAPTRSTLHDFQTRMARVALPGGAALDVREGSFNHELARYLADRVAPAPRTFVFEDLAFQSGQSTLEPASEQTIADLAAILKAFPSAEIRLEGHTDNVGAPDANQRLSLARAETVKAALASAGVPARRLDAWGFGQERPVVPNDTEEGRARNRRTELVVTRK